MRNVDRHSKGAGVRRRLFTAVSVVSLLLCAATVVLWVWVIASKHDIGAVRYGWYSVLAVRTESNGLVLDMFWHGRWGGPFKSPFYSRTGGKDYGDPYSVTDGWTFTYYHTRNPETLEIDVPDWSLILLFASPAVVWVISRRRRTRKTDCCVHCGYSLTGNTSGVCPECGTACRAADLSGASPAAEN